MSLHRIVMMEESTNAVLNGNFSHEAQNLIMVECRKMMRYEELTTADKRREKEIRRELRQLDKEYSKFQTQVYEKDQKEFRRIHKMWENANRKANREDPDDD